MPIVAHLPSPDKGLPTLPSAQDTRLALRKDLLATLAPIAAARMTHALGEEVTAAIGRPKGQHRRGVVEAPTPLVCPTCGRRTNRQVVRKGSYPRTLLTLFGALALAVPRVECDCGRCPPVPFTLVEAYNRLWSDAEGLLLSYSAVALSLRTSVQLLELPSGQTVSLGTAQRRTGRLGRRAVHEMGQTLAAVPPVIMLDGLWGTVMQETGERKRDKKGRLRTVKRGHKIPLLVALGVDPVTGESAVLAWVRGTAEGEADWTRLLTVLHERGVRAERGLRLFIHDGSAGLEAAFGMVDFGPVRRQRCLFHKLRNVLDAVHGTKEMTAAEKRERRAAVLAEACLVYEAPAAAGARARLAAFAQTWTDREPAAVETFRRDFEQTLTFYAVQVEATARGEAWGRVYLRSTSHLERVQRALRTKWRQAGAFWSAEGQDGAVWLVLHRRRQTGPEGAARWQRTLLTALLEPD